MHTLNICDLYAVLLVYFLYKGRFEYVYLTFAWYLYIVYNPLSFISKIFRDQPLPCIEHLCLNMDEYPPRTVLICTHKFPTVAALLLRCKTIVEKLSAAAL